MTLQVSQYRVVPNSNPPAIQALVNDTVTGVTYWVDGSVALQVATSQELTALRLMIADAFDVDYIDPVDVT